MISRLHLTVLIVVAAIVWGTVLILEGVSVSASWFKPIGAVVGALMIILLVFDKWLWKLRFLYPWFVSIPKLNGTWKGTLLSSWKNPETEQTVPPIEAYIAIRQTFSTLNIRLMTKESHSVQLAGDFIKKGGVHVLAGTYRNEPNILIQDRSPIHHGGLKLNVQGKKNIRLEGHYWTDRSPVQTKGTMRFIARSSTMFDDYERASKAEFTEQT